MTGSTAGGGAGLPKHLVRWWIGLGVLLLVEILSLSFRFDTTPLMNTQSWWAGALGYSPAFMGVLLAIGVATVLALSTGDFALTLDARALTRSRASALCWLAVHFACLGLFYFATWVVLERNLDASPVGPVPWMVLWLVAGLSTVGSLAGAALPIAQWIQLLKSSWYLIALATIIGLLGWAGGHATGASWSPLHEPTFVSVEKLLTFLGQDVVSNPDTYEMWIEGARNHFWVVVDESCSGYQGLGLVLVFLLAFFWLDRKNLRFPNVLVFLPIGLTAIWLLNIVRIAALLMIGAWYSQAVAVGGFHSQVGWLTFLLVALGIVLAVNRSEFFSRRPHPVHLAGGEHPEVAHLLPFVVLLAMSMVSAALSGGFDWLYPIKVIVTGAVIWVFWQDQLASERRQGWLSWPALLVGIAVGAGWLGYLLWQATGEAPAAMDAWGHVPKPWLMVWLVFRLAGTLFVVPVAEELAFRGYLTRKLISRDFETVAPGTFTWPSFLISSLAFGILHSRFLLGTAAGMLFALAYYRRGRLADAIVAHSVANLVLTIHVWLSGDLTAWG